MAPPVHEVEVKLRVADPDTVRRRMEELGAPLGPRRLQEDRFFQHPQRDLAATDEALRLRTDEGFQELTYKGPRQATDAKVREEWNIPVGADPTPFLEALGFRQAAWLRKHRESARIEACEVTLDHVEGLGWFVEVEALHEDIGRSVAAVHKTVVRLGLQDLPRVQASYLELALEAGADAAHGDAP